jgi:hypothetical protein
MTNGRNAHAELLRIKLDMLIRHFSERRRLYVAENKIKGMTSASMKGQKDRELSTWNMERGKLTKDIKREVSGFINSVFMAGYLGRFSSGAKRSPVLGHPGAK